METLDWTKLAKDVTPNNSKIPYESNKHLFTKIAFDVFQLNSSPVESLWILEESDDGDQYLVAQYDDVESQALEVKSHWKALSDRGGRNITLVYKNYPIQRFSSSEYGFTNKDIHIFQKSLINKLASDKNFTSKFLNSQPKDKLNSLVSRFPELRSLAAEPPTEWERQNDPYWQERRDYEEDLSKGFEEEPLGQESVDREDDIAEAVQMAAYAIRKVGDFDREQIVDILNKLNAEFLEA
jgi:hypothetical protein